MFTKQHTTIKIILYGALMLICYLLQSVPTLGVRFMDKAPELLLVLTVCVAFFESYTFAAFFGLAAGLLSDIVTGSIVGHGAILFMFAGFMISVLLHTLLRGFFLTYVCIELAVLGIYLLLEYTISAIMIGGIPLGTAIIHSILPKFLLSGVFAYPTYYVARFINERICPGGDE